MKKTIKLTESDLERMVKKIINEYELKFDDGEVFDTSGPIRKEERFDGWYVLGEGHLIPVNSEEEADEVIMKFKSSRR
jgi:FKBP-type peptidyl-prolyl cis-trans isomerase 2